MIPPPASATQALAECIGHPTRARILARLGHGRSSPKQLAEEFGMAINRLNYHVRRLESLGLISLVEERPSPGRRGPLQHYYEAHPLAVSDAEWLDLPPRVRDAMAEVVLRDLARAGAAGKTGALR